MKSVYKIPQKIKCLTDERKRKSIPLFNIVMPVLLFLMLQYESFHTIFSSPESMSKILPELSDSEKTHRGNRILSPECGVHDHRKITTRNSGAGNVKTKGPFRL